MPWVPFAAPALDLRPNDVVDVLGDSITAGNYWYADLAEYSITRFGTSAPTWIPRAAGGIGIRYAIDNLLPLVILDAPTVVLIELGTNEFGHTNVNSTIQAYATELILALQAGIPGVRVAWIGVWAPHTELWDNGLSPDFLELSQVVTALRAACVACGIPYISVHGTQQADEQLYNTPSPGTTPVRQDDGTYLPHGSNTYDGTHPTAWRGTLLMARAVRAQIGFTNTTYPELAADWLPNADVTPLKWVRSPSIAGTDGTVVSTWTDQGSKAQDFTASGSKRATLVDYSLIDARLFKGRKVVRFDGVDDAMTCATADIDGAKTVFAVYKLRSLKTGFADWASLLTLKGAHFSELAPDYNPGRLIFMNDMNTTDGLFIITTSDLSYPLLAAEFMVRGQMRFAATFNGGSSTDLSSYSWAASSRTLTMDRNLGVFSRTATDLCSIGGRVDSGGAVTHAAAVDVAEILVFPGVLTALQIARVSQYLSREWEQ
jgi:hypothetical protein